MNIDDDIRAGGLDLCFWTEPPLGDQPTVAPEHQPAAGRCTTFLHHVDFSGVPEKTMATLDYFLRAIDVQIFYRGDVPPVDDPSSAKSSGADSSGPDSALPGERYLSIFGERFGITADDLQRVGGIDFRLLRHRRSDHSPGYDASTRSVDVGGHADIEFALPLPAEVVTMGDLPTFVHRWRRLFPPPVKLVATISVSNLVQGLASLLPCQFDAVIVDANQDALSGLPVAAMVRRLRRQLDAAGSQATKLWVIPPPMSIQSLAKLSVLGADGIAVDHLIAENVQSLLHSSGQQQGGFASLLDEFRGLLRFAADRPVGHNALASTDPKVASILGLPYFGVGMNVPAENP